MQGRHQSRSAVKSRSRLDGFTAKTETENDGKTADNAFEINCDRVKVTAVANPCISRGPATVEARRMPSPHGAGFSSPTGSGRRLPA